MTYPSTSCRSGWSASLSNCWCYIGSTSASIITIIADARPVVRIAIAEIAAGISVGLERSLAANSSSATHLVGNYTYGGLGRCRVALLTSTQPHAACSRKRTG